MAIKSPGNGGSKSQPKNPYAASGAGTKHVSGQGSGRATTDRKKAIKVGGKTVPLPKNAGMDDRNKKVGKALAKGPAASRARQDAAAASRGGTKPISKAVQKKAEASRIKKANPYAASGAGTKHVTGQGSGRQTVDRKKAIKTKLGNAIPVPKNAGQDSRKQLPAGARAMKPAVKKPVKSLGIPQSSYGPRPMK